MSTLTNFFTPFPPLLIFSYIHVGLKWSPDPQSETVSQNPFPEIKLKMQRNPFQLGMAVHTCNLNTQKSEKDRP